RSNLLFSDHDRIVHPHLLSELGNFLRTRIVHSDAEDLQALRAVLFLQIYKPGHLDLAGLAPGRPEVEQDGLAVKIGKFERLSIKRGQREIGGWLVQNLARTGRGRAVAGLLNAEDQHDRDDHRHNNKNDGIAFHELPLCPKLRSFPKPPQRTNRFKAEKYLA